MKKIKPEHPFAEKIASYKKFNHTPLCFANRKQYAEWKELCKTSNEVCSICSDCTPSYKFEMKEKHLCEHHIWSEIVFNQKMKKEKEKVADKKKGKVSHERIS